MNLSSFTQTEALFDGVREYVSEYIKREAGDMVLRGDDTTHVKLAKEFLMKSFASMKTEYKPKQKTFDTNPL